MSYITLDEFKEEYPQVDIAQYSDTVLQRFLDRAEDRVDDYIEYSLAAADITDEVTQATVDEEDSLVIFPRVIPINSLSAVTVTKGSIDVELNLTNGSGENIYTIPEPKTRIVIPWGEISINSVTLLDLGDLKSKDFYVKVSYNGGYTSDSIPNDIKDATGLFMLDILSRRNNLSGASEVKQGNITIKYGQRNGESDFVQDAKSLLMSYKKVTGW